MKSVLSLVGVTALLVSCSGSGGDVVFDDSALAGRAGTGTGASSGSDAGGGAGSTGGTPGTAGTESTSGTDAGGNSGMSGTDAGGKPGAGGMSGASGTGGESSGGHGGGGGSGGSGGSGPMIPEVIFVASSGTDVADCGLTPQTACKTISRGVKRGVEATRSDVYVQAGHYSEVVVLKPGVSVIGGFDDEWKSGARTDAAHQVVIEGGSDETTKEYVAVWAHDLATTASLENVVIQAPDAKGQRANGKDGRSSYGVHAVSAQLSLKDVDIKAGKGENGADGDAGQDAASLVATEGMDGTVGGAGAANNPQIFCNVETSPGGLPGMNSCDGPSAVDTSGGKGGYGGSRDTSCAPLNYKAVDGGDGEDAKNVLGLAGKGGKHGTGGGPVSGDPAACGVTGSGNPGTVQNGAGGKAGTGGVVVGGFWYGAPGGNGGTGQNGGGGGGGGGSGGCDQIGKQNDSRGSGGGGGGAGGCAARAGGTGGGGGGGSFGIFAMSSNITVTNVTVTRGAAGNAGKGGSGGQGQVGGLGETGGAHPGTAAAAGKGGDGGHGGHAGGGAGGNGGASYGIVLSSGSALDGALTVMGGAAGKGGDGGPSAPNAAEILRDGNPGEKGADGGFGDKLEL